MPKLNTFQRTLRPNRKNWLWQPLWKLCLQRQAYFVNTFTIFFFCRVLYYVSQTWIKRWEYQSVTLQSENSASPNTSEEFFSQGFIKFFFLRHLSFLKFKLQKSGSLLWLFFWKKETNLYAVSGKDEGFIK